MSSVIEQRKELFNFFKDYHNPSVTFGEEVEMDDFRPELKQGDIRTGYFICYAIAKTSIDVPQFRLRVHKREMLEVDPKDLFITYVVRNKHTTLNHCIMKYTDDFAAFNAGIGAAEIQAADARKLQITYPQYQDNMYSSVNVSIMPWLRLNTIVIGGCPIVPLFSVGKLHECEQGRLLFNLSLTFHHGCIDAYHFHSFIEQLQANITDLIKQIKDA